MEKEEWTRLADWFSVFLVSIAAINSGLTYVFKYNLVTLLFNNILVPIVYLLFGIAGIWFFTRFVILKNFEVGK